MSEVKKIVERLIPRSVASERILHERMDRLAEKRDALIPKYKVRKSENVLLKFFRYFFGSSANDVYDEMEGFEKKINAIKKILDRRGH